MKIGYARVSTDDQNMAAQLDALERAGCNQIFEDQGISGSVKNRPGLVQALKALKPGDVLVVWNAEIIADRERQQRELEREQVRDITERKIQSWKKAPSGQEKMRADPTFMKALQKAVKQEDDRGKNMDGGKDRER